MVAKPCPGSRIRSKEQGRGLGTGQGKGPIGIPIAAKFKELLRRSKRKRAAKPGD